MIKHRLERINSRRIGLVMCLLLTIFSEPAFGYLDPGTGSMLMSALVGLAATILFFLKGLFFKVRSSLPNLFSQRTRPDIVKQGLVFYSEDKCYWNTFKPVLDELIRRNQPCTYLTSDAEDPGLLYSSPLITTKFIGSGTKAYSYLKFLEADVCAMTTPGLDVLQIKRSKGVNHYAHLIHAPTDVGTYKPYSFDYFDSIFASGEHQINSIRKLEELRGTPSKVLLRTGCLYYDHLKRELKDLDTEPESRNRPTVLIAPTWGANGLLKKIGKRVLIPLLQKNWDVILRPHPQSFTSEMAMLDRLGEELKDFPNLVWDRESHGLPSMKRADVMVSDISGVIFDFAYLFNKPIITVKYELNTLGLEAADLPWPPWEVTVLDTLGRQIDEKDLDKIPEIIAQVIDTHDKTNKIHQFRKESVFNFAAAAAPVADGLLQIREKIHCQRLN